MASLLAPLKEEFKSFYLDRNGLGLFEDEAQERLIDARADNPILIAAYGWAMLKDTITMEDKVQIAKAITCLQVLPGLFMRRPNAFLVPEAHDNMDAVVALDILLTEENSFEGLFSKAICNRGVQNGWQYNNVLPNKYSWKQLRQPGSICFYKLGAGWVPYPIEALALTLGLWWAMAFGWSSTHNLAWLKLRTIPVALKRQESNSSLWGWVFAWWGLTSAVCWAIHGVRKTFHNSWKNYFGPAHILTRMANVEGAI